MNRHISQDDLALFALQLLEGDELRNTLDHLEHCEDCRHEVARFQGDLVGYALAQSELHTPPAAARERLMKGVAKEKKIVRQASVASVPVAPVVSMAAPKQEPRTEVRSESRASESRTENRVADGDVFLAARARRSFATDSPEEEEREPRRGSGSSFIGWAGWAVAAGLAVTAGLQYRDRQAMQGDLAAANLKAAHTSDSLAAVQDTLRTLTDTNAMQVSLHVPQTPGTKEPPKPDGHAAYIADKGSLVFIANHMPQLQPYKTYELWLIPADGKDPIPAGTFKPDTRGIATVMMPELPKGITAKMFGVTIEDDGGSKTPTQPIVLVGDAGL